MAAKVYLSSSSSSSRTIQAWRSVLGWLAFFLHMLLRILPAAPAWARIIDREHRMIVFEAEGGGEVGFEPVPVEIPGEEGVSVDGGGPTLEKLTVVLDLDETLVCAYETSSLPDIIRIQAIEAGLKYFELECLSAEREVDGKPKINHVTVFERPGLHEFLQGISEFADIVLFTAGLEGYARPLVDRIDPGNKFSLRLYRPSTTATEYRDHVKDLSCLSKNFCRIVIVDNNPFSFLLQPLNGIPCVPFYAGQPHDDQLMVVLLPLLKQLSLQKDVRPVLYERFHMPEWFQKRGIPMSNWIMETFWSLDADNYNLRRLSLRFSICPMLVSLEPYSRKLL